MASGEEGVAEYPLRAAVLSLVEPEAATIGVLTFELRGGQLVKRSYHFGPLVCPPLDMGQDGVDWSRLERKTAFSRLFY